MIDISKFKTKSELFAYLIKYKAELISFKKSAVKNCDSIIVDSDNIIEVKEAVSNLGADDLANGRIKRTIIGNTYNWMDSHSDVHMKGIFSKSISENKNIMHLHDHIYQTTAKVGTPISVYEKSIKWSDLGINKEGRTIALMMDSEIKKSYNQMIFEEYLNKEINQHSVGMQYVKLALAVNDADYKEEFANWNSYIGNVANSEKAIEQGYFWAVTEAKLMEISAVIKGSNELTPTLNNKFTPTDEPEDSTQKDEPNEAEKIAAQEQSKKQFYLTMLG